MPKNPKVLDLGVDFIGGKRRPTKKQFRAISAFIKALNENKTVEEARRIANEVSTPPVKKLSRIK